MMLLARSKLATCAAPSRRGVLSLSSLQSVNPDFSSSNVLLSKSPVIPTATETSKADVDDLFRQNFSAGGLRTDCTAIVGTFRSMFTKMQPQGHKPSLRSLLFKRQEAIELKIEEEAIFDRKELLLNLRRIGQSTSTQKVHHGLASWYEPLAEALKEEEEMIKKKVKGVDRQVYGPYLMLLPLDRVAVVTLDVVVGQILRSDKSVKIVTLLTEIGTALENELNLERLRAMKKNNKAAMFAMKKLEELANNKKETGRVYKNVRKVLNDPEGWSPAIKTKIGGFLVETLVKTLQMPNGEPVFTCKYEYNDRTNKKAAVLVMSPSAYQLVDDSKSTGVVDPRWKPMVVPPKPWNSQAFYGAYLHLKAPLMKYTSRFQVDVVRKANIKPVLEGLDYLGKTPWRVNQKVFDVVLEAEGKGFQLGEIPSAVNLVEPKKEDYLPVDQEDPSKVNQILYGQMKRRVAKRNAELHSLRQDMRIKLDIAEEFRNDTLFFPHNLDFRGRAYPVPPNLSHIGSDMCRGLLMFAEAKELGETGLRWLKIHLANLCGYNKVPYDQRVAWIEAQMGNIRESALHPLSGEMWWSTTESPFQALAACIELANAYELPDPTKYKCALPVHQDGSCNGLQHYAGLGRDALGGKAVNLAPSDSPQDVYSKVLEIVSQKLDKDALIPEDHPEPSEANRGKLARLVKPAISRKVIKQTVMTSVYGVTAIGAKLQIQGRLEEYFMAEGEGAVMTPDQEKELSAASKYIASVTLESLSEMFQSAKAIMDWLALVSQRVAQQGHTMSWVTPLNLPVIQSYRRSTRFMVKTALQRVVLSMSSDFLPVEVRKQKSAFPPNFVHSLDSTHMLMTSLRMKEKGLTFASVHDSFWTHACDAPVLAKELRESFIELYEFPILENLRDSIQRRYPDVEVPELPKRGDLDIKLVGQSSYFFH